MIPPLSAALNGTTANPTTTDKYLTKRETGSFLEMATVVEPAPDGKIRVNLQGSIVALQPVTDDQDQYKSGTKVWVAKQGDVKIIHGVIRG